MEVAHVIKLLQVTVLAKCFCYTLITATVYIREKRRDIQIFYFKWQWTIPSSVRWFFPVFLGVTNNNNTGENLGLFDHYRIKEMNPPSDRVPSVSIPLHK